MRIKSLAGNLALSTGSILVTLVFLEIVLRFLPVSSGLRIQSVNETSPYFHGEPNRAFVFSRDWNFSLVNRGRLNAQGYVNDHDYDPSATGPLLAMIGDSMIEALMVPFEDTVHGRLARQLEGRARVYSFAFSGAPLSQYLAWAKHAVESYNANALAIFVMSNDFDESIMRYARKPGFHQYDRTDPGGDWIWVRNDYAPIGWLDVINASSLLQYLYRNLRITSAEGLKDALLTALTQVSDKKASKGRSEANGAIDDGSEKLVESRQIVDRFLRDLVQMTELPPARILFVLDGPRGRIYRGLPRASGKDYATEMLSYFMAAARAQGFEVIDMYAVFEADFAVHHRSFQFPTDGHWNSYAHGIVAKSVTSSTTLQSLGIPTASETQHR
jgi:hypothetical protein